MKVNGWGRYPVLNSNRFCSNHLDQIRSYCQSNTFIPRGLGRSYGDSALSSHIFDTRYLNCLLEFDQAQGILTCEAGVSLAKIIDAFLMKGWFIPVTPGTKYVTVGGAIASDVHGKNHHHVGCFSQFVLSLQLMLANGDIITCSPTQNTDIFRATCGGMGLTGIILQATIQLIPVKSAFIEETVHKANHLNDILELFEQHAPATYSVAWLDCTATKKNIGRSILFLGEHARDNHFTNSQSKNLSIPLDSPRWLLNRYSVKAFNHFYYSRFKTTQSKRYTHLLNYFYPLDSIQNWNRLYGKKGFLQYQFVIPKIDAAAILNKILQKIADYGGGSFLSVLKLFGHENQNLLSFPMAGYTLALDFKYEKKLFPFLEQLDAIILHAGGRVYLTKDARMNADFFQKSYQKINQFKSIREKIGATNTFYSQQAKRLGL